MRIIDLRSDTCSEPNAGMREAIAKAAVGNETWQEDPTVKQLLEMAMELTGKPAALFCCSGTMANVCAAMVYASFAKFGAEVVMGDFVHSNWYEVGNVSNIAGLNVRTVDCRQEFMPMDALEAAIRPLNGHMPKTELIWMENTYMLGGGVPIPIEKMRAVHTLAQQKSLKVHLDGARVFNAAHALGVAVKDITAYVDSVQFCLSKGLGAPFGSILAGEEDFIAEARRCRQAIGGALRQAGMMAAAGIYGLQHAEEYIGDAHRRCRALAEGLNRVYPDSVDLDNTLTNILLFNSAKAGVGARAFCDKLFEHGIKVNPVLSSEGERCRMLLYPNITDADVAYVIETVKGFQ